MRKEIENYERKELFNNFDRDNPFIFLTTKVNITNIYKNCKDYYPSIAYFITKAVNQIENFKYRYENGKFYLYDEIKPNFTHMLKDHNIGFFQCDLKDNYIDFVKEYKTKKEILLSTNKSIYGQNQGEIWFSYVPWYHVTGLVTPFSKEITVPQFIWDKFSIENDECFINLTIMVHHGFVDRYHIGLFLQKLEEMIKNIDNYITE